MLVSGAWHGSWCWEKLQRELAAANWGCTTVDLPSIAEKGSERYGLHDDAGVIRQAIDAIGGPVVIVAHSYGGAPVTEGAAGADNVRQIIYLTAFQLDEGESLLGAVGGQPPPWWRIEGDIVTPDNPHQVFFGDVPAEEADRAVERLLPQSLRAFTEELTAAAWKTIPSTYIICDNDQAIPVFAQEAMSARSTAVHRLPTSHSPFLSQPATLAALLAEIAVR